MLVSLLISSTLKLKIMKQILAIFTALLFTGFTANATSPTTTLDDINSNTATRGYGNSFIFVEQGVEFSIFPDGQFDFYMSNYGPNVNVNVNHGNTSISFNSGYDYNAYVQYDEFGAIVQVEHVPVFYDYYGRISQVGNIYINYNNFGFVTRVGGLYVHYNRHNRFSHHTGFINMHNRFYVYRPWHAYFVIPHFNHCVVYNRPYRQHYRPIRYQYTRPFADNYRRRSAVASRRGNTINRRSDLATRGNDRPRNTVRSNAVRPRNGVATSSPRSNTPKPRVASNTPRPRTTTQSNTPRPRVNTNTPKPRSTANTPRPRSTVSTQPRTKPSPRVQNKPSPRNTVSTKPRTKPSPRVNTSRPRKSTTKSAPRNRKQVTSRSSKKSKSSSRKVASNSRSRR